MPDYFSQGAGANYGPLGYGGGPAVGAGNLARTGYQWPGPTNVGEIAYQQGQAASQANPWGGDAGLRPYNPAILGTAAPSYTPPQFTNTMGGGAAYGGAGGTGLGPFGNTMQAGTGAGPSWSALAANTRAQQNPNMVAGPMAAFGGGGSSGGGGASGGWGASNYPSPGAGPMTSPYGSLDIAPNPGPGSSTWDPQNTAYNILYGGPGGKPATLVGSAYNDLGQNNLDRYQIAFQQGGGWGNQTAGGAMRGVTGAEGAGGNPFAINYGPGPLGSGAIGMNQLINDRLTNYVNAGGGSFNYSPESQAQNAVSEIQGSNRYAPTATALNNPGSTVPQMRSALIGNYEGLNPNIAKLAPQYNADMRNAARYGTTLTSLPAGWH